MNRIQVSLLLNIVLATAVPLQAESPDDSKVNGNAVPLLDGLLRRMQGLQDSVSTYRVKVQQKWTLSGESESSGSHQLVFSMSNPNRFRLSVASGQDQATNLVCAGNGTETRCVLTNGAQSCYADLPGNRENLLSDAYVSNTLRYSGLDLLLRHDLRPFLVSSAESVELIGEETLAGERSQHMRIRLAPDDRVLDLWIGSGERPLLLKIAFKQSLVAPSGEMHKLTSNADLSWDLSPELGEAELTTVLPTNATKTLDIYSYLVDGRARELLGQASPPVALQTLDGQAWSLDKHRGKDVVALVFWASFAIPSIPQTEEVQRIMNRLESEGVVFYLVNVGEKAGQVKEFVASRNFTHTIVMDTESMAAKAFGVTSLPTTIAIGRDGSIQSAHVGHTSQVVARIEEDLQRLLAGETLVERQVEN